MGIESVLKSIVQQMGIPNTVKLDHGWDGKFYVMFSITNKNMFNVFKWNLNEYVISMWIFWFLRIVIQD